MTTSTLRILAALLGASVLLAGAPPASAVAAGTLVVEQDGKDAAPAEVKAEVIVLHATNEGKGIDPAIGDLPELKKPPFSAFDTYKLLAKSNLALPKGREQQATLPDNGKLKVTYTSATGEGKGQKFSLKAAVQKPDGTEFAGMVVNTPRGKFFFIAGQSFKGGILVVGVKLL